jgi:DeoR/GlpR family transcriptional regulator of sugar metabolism
MPVYAAERYRRILNRLENEGQVRSSDLEAYFGVTAMTIWRDLALLEERGQLKRVRGGAMALGSAVELAYAVKSDQARADKMRIARYVASHCIEAGDILILDGGTTIASLAEQELPERLTILTNSLPVAEAMMRHRTQPTVYVSGGLLRAESGTMVGREAITFFSRRRAAKFLISTTAVDLEAGITDPNPQEIEVKQAMAASAKSIILLSDPSKFGQVSHMQTLPWRRIQKMVTSADHDLLRRLGSMGVEAFVATKL